MLFHNLSLKSRRFLADPSQPPRDSIGRSGSLSGVLEREYAARRHRRGIRAVKDHHQPSLSELESRAPDPRISSFLVEHRSSHLAKDGHSKLGVAPPEGTCSQSVRAEVVG